MTRHWRRFLMGFATITGWTRRGFFIPYRYADQLPQLGQVPSYSNLLPFFRMAEPAFLDVLATVESFRDVLTAIGAAPPPAPRWQQDWFAPLDAAVAYTMVRTLKPQRIIEVGSGHSTRFMARAIADGKLDTRFVAIDPEPRAVLEGLSIDIRRQTLGAVDLELFAALEAGDIVFFDSSHILMPGSDVDALLNRILPTLPAGIFIHIHDIFLPYDYPVIWDWRAYNEQIGVGPLLYGGQAGLVFASHYMTETARARVEETVIGQLPRSKAAWDSSLWLMWRGAHNPAVSLTQFGFLNADSDNAWRNKE